jgi:SPP1 gp7 family putative phage head morphogenesis protein
VTFPLPPSNEPEVVQVIRRHKAALFLQETAQMRQMARAWLEIETILEGQISALTLEIQGLIEAGQSIPPGKIVRMERYRSLLAQTRVEIGKYVDYASDLISSRQRELAGVGIQHAVEAIQASYQMAGVVGAYFDVLPVSAVEGMVGLMADGSTLKSYLRQVYPNAVEGMTQALIDGIARGKNPRVTAAAMRDGLGLGLNQAMTVARTEQLRVYRETNRMQYEASGVVEGYKRISARDERVCPACLMADDGTIYPLGYSFDEHPQGRCTLVPVVSGLPEVTWTSGQEWFEGQDPAVQESILGKEYFESWQNGQFELTALVTRRFDETWGGALVTTPLKKLTG